MPPEVIIVPFVFGAPCAVIALRMWLRHKEKMATLHAAPSNMDERIQRLEHGMESVAIEIERVGESQRFLTKVLSERAPQNP